MKRKFNFTKLTGIVFILILTNFFCITTSFAQVPQKFNYQGIARDINGNPMANKTLSLKLSILPAADATISEYEETQLVLTNEFGLYTLQIGNGNMISGTMKSVKWETGNKYIKVAIDTDGGNNFADAGTSQLLSVPYAIYADKAGSAKISGNDHTRAGAVSTSASGTGTTNYLTKFTAPNTIYNSQLFDNGTNIGLGTSSPSAKFHISNTSATVQEHIRMQNLSSTGAGRFTMYNDDATKYATFTKYGTAYAGGYAGVTSLFPYANLLAFGNNGGGFLLSNGGNIGISLFKSSTSKLKFYVDYNSEYVSIGGNASPAALIHFNNTNTSGDTLKITNSTTGHAVTDGLDIRNTGNTASIVNRENSTLDFGTNNLVRATIDASGKVGIGITAPTSKLHVTDTASTANGIIRAEYTGPSVNQNIIAVYGQSLANPNYGIGVYGSGNWRGVQGYSLTGAGLLGSSLSGFGVFGFSTNFIGVEGVSTTGTGVYANSTKNYAVYASSDSMSAGYFVNAAANSPALLNGVLRGEYTGTSSNDYVGMYGKSIPSSGFGVGVHGEGGFIGISGGSNYYGVIGNVTNSGLGTGVYGNGGANGTGVNGFSSGAVGIDGYSNTGTGVNAYSSKGFGISSIADSNSAGYFTGGLASASPALITKGVLHGEYTGSFAQHAIGVVGKSTPPSTTSGIGVKGIGNWIGVMGSNNGTVNYAGYFDGQIYATSSSSGIKAFKIDHPTDPDNKFLYHSSVESNDMMNIYNGNITTDANGTAIVILPSYFQDLNIDFKYQLTVIGTFAQAIIAEEVQNNQFMIKTNQPNVKVSWQVTGVRNDAMAKAHPVVAEVAKTGREKGKYLNPVENGKPADQGIFAEIAAENQQTQNTKKDYEKEHEALIKRLVSPRPMTAPDVHQPEVK